MTIQYSTEYKQGWDKACEILTEINRQGESIVSHAEYLLNSPPPKQCNFSIDGFRTCLRVCLMCQEIPLNSDLSFS